jgi:hypothetical protein
MKRINHQGAGRVTPLSISYGAATREPGAPVSIEALLAEADQRIYEQKAERQGG